MMQDLSADPNHWAFAQRIKERRRRMESRNGRIEDVIPISPLVDLNEFAGIWYEETKLGYLSKVIKRKKETLGDRLRRRWKSVKARCLGFRRRLNDSCSSLIIRCCRGLTFLYYFLLGQLRGLVL